MTDDATPATASAAPPGNDSATPFARLVAELSELAYEPSPDTTGATLYTATDSPTRIRIEHSGQPVLAVLTTATGGPAPRGEVVLTADTPDATQVLILYAVLNPDPAAAIAAAAGALGVPQPT